MSSSQQLSKSKTESIQTNMGEDDFYKAPDCDCGSGEKVQYYCPTHLNLLNPQFYKTPCHLSGRQPYYCSSEDTCLNSKGHDHRPLKIIEFIDLEVKKWWSYKDSIESIRQKIEKKTSEYQEIIQFYNNVSQ